MYRSKIREYYDHLSRSYRKVADFIMSNYYEVAFMTAAQLATEVDVDTTTVVRFSQRLGYNGYPDLLADIRDQVKDEIYAAYEPAELTPDNPAATFNSRLEQEHANLKQMGVHSPPEQIARVAAMFAPAKRILLVAEGYADTVAELAAQQMRHRDIDALAVEQDLVKRTATLLGADEETLVIGISPTEYGRDVAQSLALARRQGSATLGVVGSLASPVNRAADCVIYAPTNSPGPLPSIVALAAALAALVEIAAQDDAVSVDAFREEFDAAFTFLIERDPNEED